MTITSSQILEDSTQADGSRHIAFEFTFHTGEKVVKRFLRPSGFDANSALTSMESEIEAEMENNEDENLLAAVENGTDPVTAIPVHPETDTAAVRQKRFLRKLCQWAMRNRDIKWVRVVIYPVWYEFKFNLGYTPTQIQNILDLTVAQYNKFNDRLTAFHNSLSMIDGDDSYVGEIE